MRNRLIILVVAVLVICSALGIHDENPEVREWDIAQSHLPTIKIALLSDFHFSDPSDLARLSLIKRQLIHHDPDLVLFAGDYIGSHTLYETTSRSTVVQALQALAYPKPSFAVLGNHDNWDSHNAWVHAFEDSSIRLIENRVMRLVLKETEICIRGLGDYYSGYRSDTFIPDDCGARVITMTHDPMGLIDDNDEVQTISFAGHTHCGQIAFPIIGAPIVPTKAPNAMHCGRFERGQTGITSGGLGTSIVPLRFGPNTEPGWELIQIQRLN